MQPHVMQLLYRLAPGGAESLALTTLDRARHQVRGSVCGLFEKGGELVPMLDALRLPWFALDLEERSKLAGIRALASLLRRERVDVLHVQAAYLLPWAVPAACLASVRVVYTIHSSHAFEIQPRLCWIVRLLAPWLDGISCITETLRVFLMEQVGIAERRIRLVRNGIDLNRFSPAGTEGAVAQRPAGWSAHAPVFGNVARFCDAKDHPLLLRAFASVRRKHPEARLLLVGDGEGRAQAERLCATLGLGDAVHFAGTRKDVPELLRAMDVFVLSSRHEGMPVAVLEAMACGVPVVTTDVGGISELVHDGDTARMVTPQNLEALVAAMHWMLDNPQEREAMRLRALELVRSRCDHGLMLKGYLGLYGLGEASA